MTYLIKKSQSPKRIWAAKIWTKILISKCQSILKQIFRDYAHRPELDQYEGEGIDDEEQEMINAEDRRHAERAIDTQNRQAQRG